MRNHLDMADETMLIIDQGNASVISHGLDWRRTKFHPQLGMDPNRSTELGKVRILPLNTFASERLARECGELCSGRPCALTFDGCWFIVQINDISMKLYHVPI